MGFAFGTKSLENRQGVDPRLIEIDDLAIQITLVDFGHGKYAGRRTVALQAELFRDGKSRKDGVVKKSYHQTGKALDFYAFVDGKASWQHEHLAMVACAYFQAASILGYKISWGGLWSSSRSDLINGIKYGWDMPHIQIED